MNNPEENFPKSRIHNFLNDIMELCKKHNINIYTTREEGKTPSAVADFNNWEIFEELEADANGASVYWPRIESHVVRNKE